MLLGKNSNGSVTDTSQGSSESIAMNDDSNNHASHASYTCLLGSDVNHHLTPNIY